MTEYAARLWANPGQTTWRANEVPRVTADAFYRYRPEADPLTPRAEIRRFTSADLRNPSASPRHLNARELAQFVRKCRAAGLPEAPEELLYSRWGEYLEAFNDEAEARGWWAGLIPPPDPHHDERLAWVMTEMEHRKALVTALRDGTVTARMAGTNVPAKPGMVSLGSLVLTREGMKAFCDLLAIELLDAPPRFSIGAHASAAQPAAAVATRPNATTAPRFSPHARLSPRRQFTGGRITKTDWLGLREAADMASRHARTEVTEGDFIRAAARAEITLAVVCPRAVVMLPLTPEVSERRIPCGGLVNLPWSAAQGLAATGTARWRTIDGVRAASELGPPMSVMCAGQVGYFDQWALALGEPDLEATSDDCRVRGDCVMALADAVLDAGRETSQPSNTCGTSRALAPEAETVAAAVSHVTRRRDEPLAAVFAEAKRRALDQTDWQSVWAALVALADGPNRPAPLLGHVAGEGVKYRRDSAEHGVCCLTRDAFRKRFRRSALAVLKRPRPDVRGQMRPRADGWIG